MPFYRKSAGEVFVDNRGDFEGDNCRDKAQNGVFRDIEKVVCDGGEPHVRVAEIESPDKQEVGNSDDVTNGASRKRGDDIA